MKQKHLVCLLLTTVLLTLFAFQVSAQSAKPLPETYVSEDERLTLRYPAGWVLQSDVPGQVIAATDESLLNLGDQTVPSGEAAFGLIFLDSEGDLASLAPLGDDPLSILEALAKSIFQQDVPDVEVETPYALTFADHPAARMDGTFSGNSIFMIIVDQGSKNYALYVGITAVGEMPKFEPKLLAIGESVHYLPPSQ